jgi:hypothetical protein
MCAYIYIYIYIYGIDEIQKKKKKKTVVEIYEFHIFSDQCNEKKVKKQQGTHAKQCNGEVMVKATICIHDSTYKIIFSHPSVSWRLGLSVFAIFLYFEELNMQLQFHF